jgi:hypothetical protein
MADEKEKAVKEQETTKPADGTPDALSDKDLDKASGGSWNGGVGDPHT